jgi:hypothetical protein
LSVWDSIRMGIFIASPQNGNSIIELDGSF